MPLLQWPLLTSARRTERRARRLIGSPRAFLRAPSLQVRTCYFLYLYFIENVDTCSGPLLDAVVTDATLTPEDRSILETQSIITSSFRKTSSLEDPLGSEFRIGYDTESPLTRLDIGGDDQEQRHVLI